MLIGLIVYFAPVAVLIALGLEAVLERHSALPGVVAIYMPAAVLVLIGSARVTRDFLKSHRGPRS
jgi:branched-subunit amino acid transport protein